MGKWGGFSWRTILGYATALTLCGLITVGTLKLWRADLTVPFKYDLDVLFTLMLTRGALDHGWYWVNPDVGAPFGMDARAFPMDETLHFLVLKAFGWCGADAATAINLYFLLTFPLTTAVALAVLRRLRVGWGPAVVASLLYTFLPFHYLRGVHHLFLAAYFLVPLVVLLLMGLRREQGLFFSWDAAAKRTRWQFRDRATLAAVAICVLTGSAGVYYAFFACFFLLAAGPWWAWRQGRWQPAGRAVLLVALIGATVAANLAPCLVQRWRHGANAEAVRRHPHEAELYGLKISHLLFPTHHHRLATFHKPYVPADPEFGIALGVVGGVGFVALLGWLLFRRKRGEPVLELLTHVNAAGVLLGTLGGFGLAFNVLVTPLIRCYCRMGIFLGFFALAAVAVLLDLAQRRWGQSGWRKWVFRAVLVAVLVVGLYDQTSPAFVPPYEELRTAYLHDRDFVRRVEALQPADGVVWQLPYRAFPEEPALEQLGEYQHFRCYFHATRLRWSHGCMRGSDGDLWQRDVAGQEIEEQVRTLALAGYTGVTVDRFGYKDRGAALEERLAGLVGSAAVVSDNGRLAFFDLAGYTGRLRERYAGGQWEAERDRVLHPLLVAWGRGFAAREGQGDYSCRWCGKDGELVLNNTGNAARTVSLEMAFATQDPGPARVQIKSAFLRETVEVPALPAPVWFKRTVVVPPGRQVLRFRCDARRFDNPGDPRELVFMVLNARVAEVGTQAVTSTPPSRAPN